MVYACRSPFCSLYFLSAFVLVLGHSLSSFLLSFFIFVMLFSTVILLTKVSLSFLVLLCLAQLQQQKYFINSFSICLQFSVCHLIGLSSFEIYVSFLICLSLLFYLCCSKFSFYRLDACRLIQFSLRFLRFTVFVSSCVSVFNSYLLV